MMPFVRKSGVSVLVMVMFAALATASIAVSRAASGDEGKVNRTREGVGILGYDPVAYFDGAPVKGIHRMHIPILDRRAENVVQRNINKADANWPNSR